jgi:hypothetical protein
VEALTLWQEFDDIAGIARLAVRHRFSVHLVAHKGIENHVRVRHYETLV